MVAKSFSVLPDLQPTSVLGKTGLEGCKGLWQSNYWNVILFNFFLHKRYNFTLGFVDINGSVATFDAGKKLWTVIYVGEFKIKEGTWYGLKVGDTYKV